MQIITNVRSVQTCRFADDAIPWDEATKPTQPDPTTLRNITSLRSLGRVVPLILITRTTTMTIKATAATLRAAANPATVHTTTPI